MVSAPVVLVSPTGPAPLAVAEKLAPSLSVINTPLVPVLAVIVPAVVKIGVPPLHRCWPPRSQESSG